MRRESISIKTFNQNTLIGQSIIFEIYDGDFKGLYLSFVDNINDYLYVLVPTGANGLKAFVRPNEKIGINFIDKKNNRLGFDSVVLEIIKHENNILYKLEKPKSLYKVELRENFRVSVFIQSTLFELSNVNQPENEVTIIDISAKGAKISTNVQLDLSRVVVLNFSLDDKFLSLKASIARCIHVDELINHYGLKFIDLDAKTEDMIIKFCLKKQMEMLKQEKGV